MQSGGYATPMVPALERQEKFLQKKGILASECPF